jgi:hypothetical protein
VGGGGGGEPDLRDGITGSGSKSDPRLIPCPSHVNQATGRLEWGGGVRHGHGFFTGVMHGSRWRVGSTTH